MSHLTVGLILFVLSAIVASLLLQGPPKKDETCAEASTPVTSLVITEDGESHWELYCE